MTKDDKEENIFTRISGNLGLLQRNETQMTEEQKKKYEVALKKLKRKIAEDATLIAKDFIISGCRFLKDDFKDWEDSFTKEVNRILEEEDETRKAASKILFTTYDIEKFLTAICGIHDRIFYEAYAPYWLHHTSPNPMSSEYPYHNDIIDMDWWAEHDEWAKTKLEDGKLVTDYQGGVTIMMPPTEELIRKAHEEQKKRLEKWKND